MNKKILIVGFALISFFADAQITLEKIWTGQYYPKSIEGIKSMKDGEHYLTLAENGLSVSSYKTFQQEKMLVNGSFSDYFLSDDEQFVLLEIEEQKIYRHSKLGKYRVLNLTNNKNSLLFEGKFVQQPTFSPDGKKVAFVFENNLYWQDVNTGKSTQITKDGAHNKVINGLCDWVYEEEFAFTRAFEWSKNSETLAYIRFDESQVPEMSMNKIGEELYPKEEKFKYPKAGEKNSDVSVFYYGLATQKSAKLDLSQYKDFYIPKIKFSQKNDELFVLVSNRHQNQIEVLKVNTTKNSTQKILTETDKAYIETDKITLDFLDNNQFLWMSERDGFRHIYLYSEDGKLINQITKGNWEVDELYGLDKVSQKIYYQSTETGSINRAVYSIDLSGENKQILTQKTGTNTASFSNNYQYFINEYSAANIPPIFTLNEGKTGKELTVLEDNAALVTAMKTDKVTPQEFSEMDLNTVKLNTWTIKPADFSSTKKYPVFMYVYGGPGHQTVKNSWDSMNYWWFQLLAQQGYIVVSVDNRGTGGKGSDFKKATYKQLGKLEIEDQINAAKYLQKQNFVDAQRIGIFGWSYGGYMTSLAMTKGADTFKMGIAVAPVTNWRFYDTVYTERFLQTPQENPTGYDDNSPINFVDKLKGKYLLIHGSGDDNVHFQNSMRMTEALIQANKPFDMAVYPDKNHSIYGGKTRLHLYQKMTEYIKNNL